MGDAGERRHSATSRNPELLPSLLGRRSSMVIPANLSLPTDSTSKPLHPFIFPNGSSVAAIPRQPRHLDQSTSGSVKVFSPPYTSLKDLLPAAAAINSPTAVSSCYEISIRNRLVKQAAWAYLQPMSSSPGTSGRGPLHRLWLRFCTPVNACLCFVNRHAIASIAAAIKRMFCTALVRSTR